MTEFSLLREVSRTPANALDAGKPPKATSKPYSRHILGIDSGVQSHTKATPRPHQGHTKATPKPTTQAISKAGGRGNRLFSQGLGHNENCWHRSASIVPPYRLACCNAPLQFRVQWGGPAWRQGALRMPSCISQAGCGSRGDSRETRRTRAGHSPGITLRLPGAPPASAGPRNISPAYGERAESRFPGFGPLWRKWE